MTTPTLKAMSLDEIEEQLRRTSAEEAAIEEDYTTVLARLAALSDRRTDVRERRDALQDELFARALNARDEATMRSLRDASVPSPAAPSFEGVLPHGAEITDAQIEVHKAKIDAITTWVEAKVYIREIYPSLRGTAAWGVISSHVCKRFDKTTRQIAATVAHSVGRLKAKAEASS